MPQSHAPTHRLQAARPQAVFCLAGCPLRGPRLAACMRAVQLRIHTLTLKFLQGHT